MYLYRTVRWLVDKVMRLLFWFRVYGRENVPADGPVVVCANHLSWWDPFAVGVGVPRILYFMAKVEAFSYPIIGPLLPKVGAFPVHRGTADRQALSTALNKLAEGKAVAMFIEGTRSRTGELLPAYPGAAWLATRQRAPILPVAIKGQWRLFRPVRVYIGEPFELEEYYGQKVNSNELAQAGQKIMDRIQELLADEHA
ncbi:MAG TPA: lysophospholipid acyltransferase family protein [Sphingobacteriaceae bacterium]|nr:lysophospholipid acyltransferase family protein [Sphingobacteriaceae bacterium]